MRALTFLLPENICIFQPVSATSFLVWGHELPIVRAPWNWGGSPAVVPSGRRGLAPPVRRTRRMEDRAAWQQVSGRHVVQRHEQLQFLQRSQGVRKGDRQGW